MEAAPTSEWARAASVPRHRQPRGIVHEGGAAVHSRQFVARSCRPGLDQSALINYVAIRAGGTAQRNETFRRCCTANLAWQRAPEAKASVHRVSVPVVVHVMRRNLAAQLRSTIRRSSST